MLHIKQNTRMFSKLWLSLLKRPLLSNPLRFNYIPRPCLHSPMYFPNPKYTTFHFHNSSRPSSNCWKCGGSNEKSTLFCKECNVLQKPDFQQNYFDVFGVEQNYKIKANELTTKYRKLQSFLHPDRFSNRDQEEIKISEDYSSLVNKAYTTLLHPLSRGRYILRLKGIVMEERKMESSPKFLKEIMEKNEEVDEAQDEDQLQILDSQNKSTLETLAKKIEDALKCEDMKRTEELLVEMKYYESIDSKIKDLKQKRLSGD